MHEYLLVLVVAAAVTYLADAAGADGSPSGPGPSPPVRERDVHAIADPAARRRGDAARVRARPLLVASRLPYLQPDLRRRGEIDGRARRRRRSSACVGAIDDIRELDWLTKLAGQIARRRGDGLPGRAAAVRCRSSASTVLPTPVLVALTILVVLVSTNAVNFIDGLDGLAAGVVGIAALAFFAYSSTCCPRPTTRRTSSPRRPSSPRRWSAAALGFLPHNFHPARLFMGDSGSMLLGLLLSAATISAHRQRRPQHRAQRQLRPSRSSCRCWCRSPSSSCRCSTCCWPWSGGPGPGRGRGSRTPEHLHHRLLEIGHTHRRAVLLLYLWAALLAMGAVSFAYVDGWLPIVAIAALTGAAVVLTVWLPRWRPSDRL